MNIVHCISVFESDSIFLWYVETTENSILFYKKL